MEALECIRGRRSVRRFSDAPVAKEEIERIVDTARFAPTWKNSQTVRYTISQLKCRMQRRCGGDSQSELRRPRSGRGSPERLNSSAAPRKLC
ncbi:nitroreductase family protein [Pyramidobacter sp. YE332]|uniref:nitroreductase family protein n=1 Tax=Pyramidobacter sp. YE332 TaxID=3068894 RepID=UPI00294B6DE4|nr:nitroreductase family protein [Pyramidobacter sp. YE332]WOL39944.1 nitroreductase family protein [Pyramidobacter sp. YE332]